MDDRYIIENNFAIANEGYCFLSKFNQTSKMVYIKDLNSFEIIEQPILTEINEEEEA